ncbi:porin [Brumimicrobium salinarum]|nr:porin [Brumimicrobium salinarum]
MKNIKVLLILWFAIVLNNTVFSQLSDYTFGEGLTYKAKDSSFSMNASVRFQTLFISDWSVRNDDFNNIGDLSSNFLIRRARVKFDGFAYSPKLKYKIELALANRDTDHSGESYYGEGGNIVLDAYLKWNFYKPFSLKVGQFKLAGNRERLLSSANLQFVDRSLLNSRFTLDRDIGASLHFDKTLGDQFGIELSAAFTQGEGRNIISGNLGGYQTTFKAEIMPFGQFKNGGAYVGADVYREETPKLAYAIAFDKNTGVSRSRGNTGLFFPNNVVLKDLMTIYTDLMFKYNGFSLMGEYVYRKTSDNNPRIFDNNGAMTIYSYFTGSAVNLQSGYLFKNNFEVSLRYTALRPYSATISPNLNHYLIGFSKYIKNHSLKVQTDLGYLENEFFDDGLTWRMQIEFGF